MIFLLASIAAAFPSGGAAANSTKLWQVSRYDYREFCSGDRTTIDLRTGKITALVGACDPNSDAAPTRVQGSVAPALLRSLRNATRNPGRDRFIDAHCEKHTNVSPNQTQVLSGASKWAIERGASKFVITFATPCLTEVARTMIKDVDDAIRGLNNRHLR